MNPFEINLVGETYKIQPQEDGTYHVFITTTVYGVLTPRTTDTGVVWESDSINENLAQQIGELIEEHEM